MSDVENPGNNLRFTIIQVPSSLACSHIQKQWPKAQGRGAIYCLGKDYIDLRHRCGDNLKFYNEDGLEEIQEKAREYITGGKIVQSKAKKSKHSTKLIFVMSTDKLYVVFSELQE
ncbi:hypothetical protein G4B88_000350 [Cannabis sativa]|uniref:Uncharacterized protein n=1 Tax=Cannabis sativa TaxID=3483 RepID=A0A7J6F3D1_CANSA|nr:hypothetical protein G4B88_000350 [Cannabis sativa]